MKGYEILIAKLRQQLEPLKELVDSMGDHLEAVIAQQSVELCLLMIESAEEGGLEEERVMHLYNLQFVMNNGSPGRLTFTDNHPWTPENELVIEGRARLYLDYMFEGWSDLVAEPVCSCCKR